MKVIRAASAGFCFGVERAVALAREAGSRVETLGELIHNPEVLEELETRGVRAVDGIANVSAETVIVRAHGISDRTRSELQAKTKRVIDASCPFVQRLHAAVAKFRARGLPVIVFGRRDHPEMRAVVEDFPEVVVTTSPLTKELDAFAGQTIGMLAQTTEQATDFDTFVAAVTARLAITPDIASTICNATTDRQTAARVLADQVEAVVVIGGRTSNNTKNLWELTSKIRPSYWIERADELDPAWFAGCQTVGVTAGASTPESAITAVIERLEGLAG